MTLAATVVGVSPAVNPDTITYQVVFSGNYGVNGTGDQLNLAPYDQINNPTGAKNPNNLALPAFPLFVEQTLEVVAEAIGGYYVQPSPLALPAASNGVAPGISPKTGLFLRQYAPGGTELASNAAYNAAVTAAGAGVLVALVLPKDQ